LPRVFDSHDIANVFHDTYNLVVSILLAQISQILSDILWQLVQYLISSHIYQCLSQKNQFALWAVSINHQPQGASLAYSW
jgi:hypothetical protein